MNKGELVEAIAARTDMSKTEANRMLDALLASIVDAVANGDGVTLVGFGSFRKASRDAREGRNPKTGAVVNIAATVVPKFTPGADFRTAVAKAAAPR